MLRILGAFAWMRWRVLMNSLERTGARDVMERFSLAIDQIAPIVALVVLVPSALALGAAASYVGFAVARGEQPFLLEATRFLLMGAAFLSVFGALFLPASGNPGLVRLLLLPVPRRTLYVAQAIGAISEPWILLVLPIVIMLPVGLAAGGALAAAAAAAAAGALVILVLLGLSAAATLTLQLVVRDRRRGELAALLLILILPALAFLPNLTGDRHWADGEHGTRANRERRAPEWVRMSGRALAYAPPALYVAGVKDAAAAQPAATAARLSLLALHAAVIHALAFVVFRRLLGSPASSGARRRSHARPSAWRTLPGTSSPVSAIAFAQLRLAMRTPRGRSILLSPVIAAAVFGVVMMQSGGMDVGPIVLNSGLALATVASTIGLLAILPFAANQFAIDGAGLTLVLLAPVSDDQLLDGKMIGIGLTAAAPVVFCIMLALLLFRGGPAWGWLALPLGLLATYLLVAPLMTTLSLLFPRAVDLNSIGHGSNAQGFAGFIGLLAFVAAGAPAILMTIVLTRLTDRAALLPLALLAWCVVAFAISRLLRRPVRALLRRRRENLAMVG